MFGVNMLFEEKYILPSPAGSYYCVSSEEVGPAKTFLQKLLIEEEAMQLNEKALAYLVEDEAGDQEQVLKYIQNFKWLQGFDQATQVLVGSVEEILPKILQQLSSNGKALLADNQGLYLASAGFTHEVSEELSALSGDLSSLYMRHQGIIKGNLNIKSSAFSLVDAAGYSQLGFWPIYIGDLMFVLVISGVPRLDQTAFVNLIWSLYRRYFTYEKIVDSDVA